MRELRADPSRMHLPETHIPVRALNTEGRWDNIDISHLTAESLDEWLRSRNIEWPIGVVKFLLGHEATAGRVQDG